MSNKRISIDPSILKPIGQYFDVQEMNKSIGDGSFLKYRKGFDGKPVSENVLHETYVNAKLSNIDDMIGAALKDKPEDYKFNIDDMEKPFGFIASDYGAARRSAQAMNGKIYIASAHHDDVNKIMDQMIGDLPEFIGQVFSQISEYVVESLMADGCKDIPEPDGFMKKKVMCLGRLGADRDEAEYYARIAMASATVDVIDDFLNAFSESVTSKKDKFYFEVTPYAIYTATMTAIMSDFAMYESTTDVKLGFINESSKAVASWLGLHHLAWQNRKDDWGPVLYCVGILGPNAVINFWGQTSTQYEDTEKLASLIMNGVGDGGMVN